VSVGWAALLPAFGPSVVAALFAGSIDDRAHFAQIDTTVVLLRGPFNRRKAHFLARLERRWRRELTKKY
jgi:hypothetical protein